MTESKTKSWVIGVVVGVLLVGAGVGGVKFYQNRQAQKDAEFAATLKITERKDVPAGVPVQRFYEYDLTKHKAMFVIQAVDANSRTMSLKFIFPSKLQDNIITSKVTCGRGETWIFASQDNIVAPAEKTVYEEERIIPGTTIMQGKCSDQYCRTIRKYCEVWL